MRAIRWLVLALVLFVVAAWLMRSGDGGSSEKKAAVKVEIPRHATPSDYARRKKRSTLLETIPAQDPDSPPTQVHHDPFLLALPPAGPRDNAVVVEANAIRHSSLGERLIACISEKGGRNEFEEMKKHTGLDVLEDLDRVGITENVVTMSGNFGGVKFDEFAGGKPGRNFGDHGRIFETEGQTFAVWKDEVLLMGMKPSDVEAAIDRMEGRGEKAEPPVSEDEAYGEIYGHLSPELLLGLVPEEHQDRLRSKLEAAAKQIDLHVNVEDDVGMVVSVKGDDTPELSDLAKSLGSALALGRTMAKAKGDDDLAEILDQARVARSYRARSGAAFDAELALPRALLEKHLAKVCPGPRDATDAARTEESPPIPEVEH